MKIVTDMYLEDFEFWGGAKALAELLTNDEMDAIEEYLEDTYEELTATELNDIFWFGDDEIANVLGYEDEEQMWDKLLERKRT